MKRLDEVLVAAIERELGPDHPETLAARLDLAIGKADAGPTRDVFEMVEQLREDMLRVLGEEHPELERVDALLTQMRNSADSEQ
ncbi:hypothetical protein ED92_26805 [Amycolatopsis sp. MJM2582]|uniref:hypothetical protein n=1 Tax=Amycolatopsis TaxID=1813 RepID=UPI000505A0FC|nr:hypothetical protein [Amycolatopsis sp. MJM2582]KFZ79201.1 hypothetical protein ED92_26805 [Amycolatopsis sp. MJM2582]